MKNIVALVRELVKLPNETAWVEFKHNNYSADLIGEDISALSNAAAYYEKEHAYMIWGVDNVTHEIVGTDMDQYSQLVGKQEIESWLRLTLSKNAAFDFYTVKIDGKKVVVLIIDRAIRQTVMFKKAEYIRVGSYTKKLSDFPTMQAKLWDRLRADVFEKMLAKKDLTAHEALALLDYHVYFNLKEEAVPISEEAIMHYMKEENLIEEQDNGLYGITNLGAILFAKQLSAFPTIERKAIRVVQYKGDNKLEILKEFIGNKGYAIGFEGLIQFLEAMLPTREEIKGPFREKEMAFPLVAIREIVANALIHQDFSITGTGPIVEVFDKRLEITNPGLPLVEVNRIIDNPPKSRNEKLASLMRRLKMCEELGSGWDRVVMVCEMRTLPAPKIMLYEENMKVVMFSEIPFTNLPSEEKLWSCYSHACVKYVSNEPITNKSLRERFGVEASSSASISRLIKEAVSKGMIKPLDPDTAPKHMKYIPYWA